MNEIFSQSKLFCPGPTPISDKARMAMLDTAVYHRTNDFYKTFLECRKMLSPFFGTKVLPYILTSSGSGAMESAVVNLTNTADEVLVIVAGKFGERWQELTQAYQCKVHTLEVPAGGVPKTTDVTALMQQNPNIKAVFFQANETSTGVFFPVEELCREIRAQSKEVLIVVDAISALVAHEIKMDAWQIDCVVSGSQKGFGIPPGLAFIAFSKEAWGKLSERPRYYFDMRREAVGQNEGISACTPASNLVLALHAALTELTNIGLENLFQHHRRLCEATRAAMTAMGLELVATKHYSYALTAAKIPPDVDGGALIKCIRSQDQVVFAGGQGALKGKIIRMAHLGFINRLDLIAGISALELGLKKIGHKFPLGAGLAAALSSLEN